MYTSNQIIMLAIRVLVEAFALIYALIRIKKYIESKCNNNITGDVFLRWEHVSFIDKYHIRERLFGGSRLRIKRDPKRYEIKYYYLGFIPVILFIAFTYKIKDNVIIVITSLLTALMISLIINSMEKRKPVLNVFTFVLYIIAALAWIYTVKTDTTSEVTSIPTYISFGFLALLFLYSVFRKRIISIIVCGIVIASSVYMHINTVGGNAYQPVITTSGTYVFLIILQVLYNMKALKKITFIR